MRYKPTRFFHVCLLVALAWLVAPSMSFVGCSGEGTNNTNNNTPANSNDNANNNTEQEPANNNEPVNQDEPKDGKEPTVNEEPKNETEQPVGSEPAPPEDAGPKPDPTPESDGTCKPEDCKTGPTGNPGPAWSSSFAGFTTATLNGNNGGWTGLKAKCTAQFSGSHVCSQRELARMLQNGTLPSMTGKAAWVIGSNFSYPNESKIASNCSGWDSDDPSDLGTTIVFKSNGNAHFFSAECNTTRPVACCMD
ncbi:MAG: hypothetical protein EP343_28030 [Deltaproteobacteria bacterium]|nr:MAG: hypothetical protein EP343_28030 [Deltaproteobacteria bacterium]